MSYAVIGDVTDFVPSQIWTPAADSQPNEATITDWLTAQSRWLDSTLRWKYTVPITDAGDVALLKPIVARLVAAQVLEVLGGHDPTYSEFSGRVRKVALEMLAYSQAKGQSMLVLPNSGVSDSGEAAVGQAQSTFTDPAETGSVPFAFRIGEDQW